MAPLSDPPPADVASPRVATPSPAPPWPRAATPSPAPPWPRGAPERWLAGACLALTAYFLMHLAAFHYGRDQGIYAVVGEGMTRGLAPYKDLWDFKPPGIFLLYAGARTLFGGSVHAVRVLETASWVSLVGAFGLLSKRFVGVGWPGLLGGLLAVLTHVQLEFWHTGQPESFGAVVLVWALVAAGAEFDPSKPGGRRKQLAAWALSGALYACASLLKPPLGGGFLVSLGFALRAERRRPSAGQGAKAARPWLETSAAFAVGALAPVALTIAYFAAKGALGDLYQTLFVFTPNYTKLGFRAEWLLGFVFLAFEQWVFSFSAFNVVGLALLLGLPSLGPRGREGAWHVVGVVAFQLVGVGLQAKFFPYHYGAALPFAGLLAGWGYAKLWRAARAKGRAAVAATFLLVPLLYDARTATRDLEDSFWSRCRLRLQALTTTPAGALPLDDYLHSVADVNAGANRKVAEWLREHTPAGSSVYIWGFEPAIYDLAGRRPASRYIYNVPQRVAWGREGARRELLAELERARPAAFVVERNDVFSFVTGDRLDSAASLETFDALRAVLARDYELATTIEDFDVYRRAGGAE
ncbi:MAG: hypothetical protein MUF34_26490 [Polyangiaceae bacterium]|nr:hypothetical protein [Polyangiaceae bacterium]